MELANKIIEIIDTERAELRVKLDKLFDEQKSNEATKENEAAFEAILTAWAHVSVMRSKILNLLFKGGDHLDKCAKNDPVDS